VRFVLVLGRQNLLVCANNAGKHCQAAKQGYTMIDNRRLVDDLFQRGQIRMHTSRLLTSTPQPMPPEFSFDKIEGMLLGLAVGDALGNSSESKTPARRRALYGEIRNYLPGILGAAGKGYPSDDTQMAFWTLEHQLRRNGIVPGELARTFSDRRSEIVQGGRTFREFTENFRTGKPWQECGVDSIGNGALMRIAPVLVPHLRQPSPALWADVALAGMLTHNAAGSNAACLAFTAMLWELLAMQSPPAPLWWVTRYEELAAPLEGPAVYKPRGGAYRNFAGPVSRFVKAYLPLALQQNRSAVDACEGWLSGAYLLETIPSVLYILMKHGDSFEEAIVRSVNDTKDNDTVAAIAGACLGALYGRSAIPQRWIDGLPGRTRAHDRGRIYRLIDAARSRWSGEPPVAPRNDPQTRLF